MRTDTIGVSITHDQPGRPPRSMVDVIQTLTTGALRASGITCAVVVGWVEPDTESAEAAQALGERTLGEHLASNHPADEPRPSVTALTDEHLAALLAAARAILSTADEVEDEDIDIVPLREAEGVLSAILDVDPADDHDHKPLLN